MDTTITSSNLSASPTRPRNSDYVGKSSPIRVIIIITGSADGGQMIMTGPLPPARLSAPFSGCCKTGNGSLLSRKFKRGGRGGEITVAHSNIQKTPAASVQTRI